MDSKQISRVLVIVACATSLGACAGMSRRENSTLIGTAVGGVAGAAVTGGSTVGTVGGAVVGAAVGNEVGKKKENR